MKKPSIKKLPRTTSKVVHRFDKLKPQILANVEIRDGLSLKDLGLLFMSKEDTFSLAKMLV